MSQKYSDISPLRLMRASSNPKRVRQTAVSKRSKVRRDSSVSFKFYKTPFPKRFFNTVSYTEAISVTLSGGIGQYVFSTNGLYDPNTSGPGGQPLYFDQLTAIYDHYTVVRSKCRFMWTSTSAMILRVGTYIDDDSSVGTGAMLAASRPGGKFVTTNTPYSDKQELTMYWDQKTAFGPGGDAEPNLQGSSSANPQEQQHFVINFTDPGGSANVVDLCVVIEYQTIWNEFATIGAS